MGVQLRIASPFLLLLLLLCRASAQSCIDDEEGLAKIASARDSGDKYTGLGCIDAINFCDQPTLQGSVVRSLCCETCSGSYPIRDTCLDDDRGAQQISALVGRSAVSSCADVQQICRADTTNGRLARGFCCATCRGNSGGGTGNEVVVPRKPVPENLLPPNDGAPLQLFLLGGQSECVGGASASDLQADSETYPELQGELDGVWFAGYHEAAATDRFFVRPLSADVDRSKFGPEVSFGERIYEITQTRTMVVKYCVGGTNVRQNWNPDTPENSWDKASDDGTSQWLEDNANLVFSPKLESKNHLFKNMIYTIRRTRETLEEAGIPYYWAGIVWVQGAGDKDQEDPMLWKTFGENTARVWNGFRQEIGSPVPIVDQGSAVNNQLKSGKEYATQIVDGCQAVSVEFGSSADDDTSNDCVVSTKNPCLDAPNRHQDWSVFEYYGYDPNVPPELLPSGATSKTFDWFVRFPTNLHSAYEGMILKGRMLANAYLRTFTDHDPSLYAADDVALQFPMPRCPDGVLPSDDFICWIDYREEALMQDDLCAAPVIEPMDWEEVEFWMESSAKTVAHGLSLLLVAISGAAIVTMTV